jgi:hypothetical protein
LRPQREQYLAPDALRWLQPTYQHAIKSPLQASGVSFVVAAASPERKPGSRRVELLEWVEL